MPYRQNFPIPAVIDPPKQCLQIWIPNHPDWKAVIAGLLWELSYWFNWERTGDMSGAQCAAVWKQVLNSVDWSNMSCCCTPPAIIVRINSTTGMVEQSSDNGTTWEPQAGGLPSVIVQPTPPVTSGVAGTKCDAATNVRVQVEEWVAHVSDDFTTAISVLEFGAAVLEAILIAVITILSAGTLTAVEALVLPTIAAALYAAWGAGKTVFDDYWTTDAFDTVLCAVFCHIGADGSFTDNQFSATWNQINTDLPPSPAKMLFMGFLSSVGTAGLNAMAASGLSADADCSDCVECLTCQELWSIFGAGHGSIVAVTDEYLEVASSPDTGGDCYLIIKTPDQDIGCYVNHLEYSVGSASLQGWTDVGQPQVEGAPQHVGLGFGSCCNYVQLQDASVFLVKIFFDDCA
jgi:hypothetical protein